MKQQPTLDTQTVTRKGSRVGYYLLWPVLAPLYLVTLAGIYTVAACNRLLTWITERV